MLYCMHARQDERGLTCQAVSRACCPRSPAAAAAVAAAAAPPPRLDSTCSRVLTTSIGCVAMEAVAEQAAEQSGKLQMGSTCRAGMWRRGAARDARGGDGVGGWVGEG